MAWYNEKYGWESNPFNVKPDPETFVGFKEIRDQCFEYIESGDAFHIYGKIGTGKTTLAQWIATEDNKISGDYQIQYFDAERLEEADLNQNLFNKIQSKFSGKSKRVILIDEAQELDKKLSKTIKSMYDNDEIFSVGLVSLDQKLDISDSFNDRIGQRSIKIESMSLEEAQKMIEKRLEDRSNPFPKELIEQVYNEVNGSPRKILETLEHLAMDTQPGELKQEFVEEKVEEKKIDDEGLTSSELLDRITPTQAKAVKAIKKEGGLTAKQLTNDHSVGKNQKSARQHATRLTDKEYLEDRNLSLKILEKNDSSKPYTYHLTENAERVLAED